MTGLTFQQWEQAFRVRQRDSNCFCYMRLEHPSFYIYYVTKESWLN